MIKFGALHIQLIGAQCVQVWPLFQSYTHTESQSYLPVFINEFQFNCVVSALAQVET